MQEVGFNIENRQDSLILVKDQIDHYCSYWISPAQFDDILRAPNAWLHLLEKVIR